MAQFLADPLLISFRPKLWADFVGSAVESITLGWGDPGSPESGEAACWGDMGGARGWSQLVLPWSWRAWGC